MAELFTAEIIVIHGFCVGEATGRALRIPDPDPDAEPDGTIVAPIVSEPVALQDQKTLPMLRALAAHAHIQAQPVRTTPDDATGYYALGSLSTNDPDVEPYAGRKVTLPDGTAKVIQLAYNATSYTVDAKMAGQVNAGRPSPLVTVGQQVRAVWLPDAAEYVAPEPAGPAYYTAAQVDSILAGLSSPAWDSITGKPDLPELARDTLGAALQQGAGITVTVDDPGDHITIASTITQYTDEKAQDAAAALLLAGSHSGVSFAYDDPGNALSATVTGGGSGGGSVLTQVPTKTAAFTATAGQAVPLDTSSGTFTLTFPTGAAIGSQVAARWTAGAAAPTISAPSGETIGAAQTTTLNLPPGTSTGEFVVWQKWTATLWLPAGGFKPQVALDARYDARYIAYETGVTTAFRAANTAAQTIPTGTNTVVLFPTVQSSSPLVTTSTQGAGTLFTVSRAGTWAITATVRLPGSASGSALVSLQQSVSGTPSEMTAITGVFGGGSFGRSISVVDYFAAGTGFYVNLFQDSGASMNTEPLSGARVNFRLAWVHP